LGQVGRHCAKSLWLDHGRAAALDATGPVVERYRAASLGAAAHVGSEGRRWGDLALSIQDVSIRGSGPRGTLVSGRPAEITLKYRCQAMLDDVVLGLAVHKTDGVNSDTLRQRLPAFRGTGRAAFRSAALPLTEGEYLLSVSAHDHAGTRVYDHHDRLYAFAVRDPHVQVAHGVASFPGRWRVSPARVRISATGAATTGRRGVPRRAGTS